MAEIKERPLSLGAHDVLAIGSGQKTVLRRLVKGGQVPKEGRDNPAFMRWTAVGQYDPRYGYNVSGETEEACASELSLHGACKIGRVGERLWVREVHGTQVRCHGGGCGRFTTWRATKPDAIDYSANGIDHPVKWRNPITMARHQSRLLLEIVSVRVERLRDASDLDLLDELGAMLEDVNTLAYREFSRMESLAAAGAPLSMSPEMYGFKAWWDKANGRGNFDANPWVWRIEVKVISKKGFPHEQ